MDVAVKDTSFCAYLCLYTGIMYVSICNMECTACVCVFVLFLGGVGFGEMGMGASVVANMARCILFVS